MAAYCSVKCQKADWAFWHKPVCAATVAANRGGLGSTGGKEVALDGSCASVLRLEAAVKRGDATAHCYLGALYVHGVGVAIDEDRAMTLFREGARLGDPYASVCLGRALTTGLGKENPDPARALEVLLEAARAGGSVGPADALILAGSLLMRMGRTPEAIASFEKAYKSSGSPAAALQLGRLLLFGHGLESNQKRAIPFIRLAAKSSCSFGAAARALLAPWDDGRGLRSKQSNATVLKNGLVAAGKPPGPDSPSPENLLLLSVWLLGGIEGVGVHRVEPDREGGERLLRRAADAGHIPAVRELGMLLGDEGLLTRAAEAGDALGAGRLAILLGLSTWAKDLIEVDSGTSGEASSSGGDYESGGGGSSGGDSSGSELGGAWLFFSRQQARRYEAAAHWLTFAAAGGCELSRSSEREGDCCGWAARALSAPYLASCAISVLLLGSAQPMGDKMPASEQLQVALTWLRQIAA